LLGCSDVGAQVPRGIWKGVEHLKSSLLLDELCERLELKLKSGDLLSRLLELVIIGLDLLLRSLVFLVKHYAVFFHNFFGTCQGVIHQLQLVEVLLTVYQLVNSILKAVTFLLETNLLLLLYNVMSFLELLPLILDLFFILTIFL
jgi:hypothetical protein